MVTTPLTAQERVILFCSATGISYAALGITAHAMQSMAIKGIHRPPSRDRHVCAHGQRTCDAPCHPWGCGADIGREAEQSHAAARGRDGGVREELAVGVTPKKRGCPKINLRSSLTGVAGSRTLA